MALPPTAWRSLVTFAPFLPLGGLLLVACSSSSGAASPADGGGADAEADGAMVNPDGSTGPGTDGGPDGAGPGPDGSTGPGADSGGKPTDGGGTTGNTSSAASWFPPSTYFNQPVETAPLDPSSATIISTLVTNGGWGGGSGLQIDTSIDVYYADASSKRVPFVTAANLAMPDSDIPTTVPIAPSTAASSAAPGFESNTACSDVGDCHYLVVDPTNHQLIEVYGATTDGTSFSTLADGRSVAIWDFTKSYLGSLRGDVCTSADASGGMMAPLLFTAEEVAAGHIDHAIRFILPNTRIQNKEYVRPATHGTGSTSGWAQTNGVPYGARFRLHKAFDTSKLTAGAKVVAAALMKYGMILSDGGNISFTAKSDAFSTTKWANLLGAHDLSSIAPTDFDMVDASYGSDAESSSKRYDFTSYNCVRNP